MSDRREARLLLAILREDWEQAASLARRVPPSPDRFLLLCRTCDVHPSVHALLDHEGRFALVGGEIRDGLSRLRHKCRMDNLLLLARLEQALDLLSAAGISPVVLKGVDVIHRFAVEFDARTLDDVDLLVSPADFGRTVAVLEAAGWEGPPEGQRIHWLRSSYEMPLESPGPVSVSFEIHWGLGQERRYRVPTPQLIRRALPLDVAGRPARRLEEHDAAAHLLLHHVQHYFDRRLKWALDLGRIARGTDFNWGEVADRVDAWGGRAAAGMALRHLRKLFPGIVPAEALHLLPASPGRRLLTAPLRSTHPLDYFVGTRRRGVQLVLAAALYEHPFRLPAYLLHRSVRDRHAGDESPERYPPGAGDGSGPG
jgi:hypothetical protein